MNNGRIYTRVDEIRGRLRLSSEESRQMEKTTEQYPMAVPDYYLSLIDPSDKEDPIRRMCIPAPEELDTVSYISKHKEISNVLISGGDSLMMSNEMIRRYLHAFSEMDHLDLIRLGTRIPVVFPDRIRKDSELQDIFRHYAKKKQLYVVIQFNHPREMKGRHESEAYPGERILL